MSEGEAWKWVRMRQVVRVQTVQDRRTERMRDWMTEGASRERLGEGLVVADR